MCGAGCSTVGRLDGQMNPLQLILQEGRVQVVANRQRRDMRAAHPRAVCILEPVSLGDPRWSVERWERLAIITRLGNDPHEPEEKR